ncbi:MAG TPA: mechanosensitive ion channel domain-containing protein [Anditalea sp.]|nr:mechanosensitive ion channel domain-containing protein [Anditalea sp.]
MCQYLYSFFLIFLFYFGITLSSIAQTPQQPANDLLTRIDTAGPIASQPAVSLDDLIRKNESYTIALNHINAGLKRSFDTITISRELPELERTLETVGQRLDREESSLNLRYLSALENLVVNFRAQVNEWQNSIDSRNEDIQQLGEELATIRNDRDLQLALTDTTILPEYQLQTEMLQSRLARTDSVYRTQRLKMARVQSRISSTMITLNDFNEDIDERQSSLGKRLFSKETSYIWERPIIETDQSLRALYRESLTLNEIILGQYFSSNWLRHILIAIAGGGFLIWFITLIRRIKKEKEYAAIILERAIYIPKNPVLSALMVILPLAPFFYLNPPPIFLLIILVLTAISATFLIYNSVNHKAFYFWLGIFAVFLIYSLSNLLVEQAFRERWVLLSLSIAGMAIAYKAIMLLESNPKDFPKYISYFIYLYIGLQFFSLASNIFGRYGLSKMLGVASTTSLVQAITLYAFVTIILEAIYLQLEVGKSNQKEFASYFDFRSLQKRLKNLLIGLALIVWGYYFAQNLNLWDFLYDQVSDFLNAERHLGSFNYTFGSILIFVLLIWVATILARNIAYFAEMKDQAQADSRNKRLGSSILLIRLGILIIGFMLAITASGIPMDRIAIVLGALSVGIGFGLQTIVNNLVSGVILAFERPIQIGDTIEVGTRIGTVKEVGIRSSKLKGYDGSEVIIPNGDLLSQHLINWTLTDKNRRVELFIGVAYGSDADKVKEILLQVMDRETILKVPAPAVYLQNFADSAVEFRLLFWVSDINTWIIVRSEIMTSIYKAFAENDIEIPFPQRDLHVKSMPQNNGITFTETKYGKDSPSKDN